MQEENKNDSGPESLEAKKVPIRHVFPEDQRTLFSNHIVAQRSEDGEFVISFFDITKPVFLSIDEADSNFQGISSVDANCIARIAVSERRLPKFIAALVEIYDAHRDSVGASELESSQENKHAS